KRIQTQFQEICASVNVREVVARKLPQQRTSGSKQTVLSRDLRLCLRWWRRRGLRVSQRLNLIAGRCLRRVPSAIRCHECNGCRGWRWKKSSRERRLRPVTRALEWIGGQHGTAALLARIKSLPIHGNTGHPKPS